MMAMSLCVALCATPDAGNLGVLVDGNSITLSGQKGELDMSGDKPMLKFSTLAKSTLPVAVRRIRLGVLFAEDAQALAGVEVAKLYKGGANAAGTKNVGVIDQSADVQLASGGEAVVQLSVPIDVNGPSPRSFVTHVLGYELADATGALLLELLGTQAASDELAAVQALGLNGDATARSLARKRWQGKQVLVTDLVAELKKPVIDRPSESETFRRVYAVRALGVLGGENAASALRTFLAEPMLKHFDEPLQVLRIARLVGSVLETPLAFAVPTGTQGMSDVVKAAIDDLQALAVVDTKVPGSVTAPELEKVLATPSPVGSPGSSADAASAPQASDTMAGASATGALDSSRPSTEESAANKTSSSTHAWLIAVVAAVAACAGACLAFIAMRRKRDEKGAV